MTTLTKDQIQKLAPQERIAIASMEAQRVQMKQHLAERARGYGGLGVVGGLPMGLAMLSLAYPRAMAFAIIAVVGLVGFHVAGLKNRLDALIQLLDPDDNNRDSCDQEREGRVA